MRDCARRDDLNDLPGGFSQVWCGTPSVLVPTLRVGKRISVNNNGTFTVDEGLSGYSGFQFDLW
jgi:hypothetical protein